MKTMLGWHFLAEDRRMQFGARELVEAGRTYTAVGALALCQNGLHASKRAIDALHYAPGPIICRVSLRGERIDARDKSVARERSVRWMADATLVLHEFALVCGHEALGRQAAEGHEPDARSWAALTVKAQWLHGTASLQELSAAGSAAWLAAEAAARAAAWSAAKSAAWSAARAAAGSAAGSAAWLAAEAAARAAAWSAAKSAAWSAAAGAAKSAARSAAEAAAGSAAGSAARSAAWSAAKSAARSAQNLILEMMLDSLHE